MKILDGVSICELVPLLDEIDSEGVLSLADDGAILISNRQLADQPVFRIFRKDGKLERELIGDANLLS